MPIVRALPYFRASFPITYTNIQNKHTQQMYILSSRMTMSSCLIYKMLALHKLNAIHNGSYKTMQILHKTYQIACIAVTQIHNYTST